MSTIQPVRFDKYLLLDRIAFGGMAEVFRAKLIGAEGFEKPVVLKKMLPHLTDEKEMVNHFIDEARLAAHLKHENIIHIYDFGLVDNSFFIAMEYLFGKDLHEIIQRSIELDRPLDLENILFIIAKVCEGLGYAHQLKDMDGNPLNIIHRDISPHNIFITYDGQIKLIDFGIAKAASKSTKTQTGIIKGKAAYMSPEQAAGETINHRSDIFAVGIILYELVTGKKMFEGDTFKILAQVIQADYQPVEQIKPNLPFRLKQIIQNSLQKIPDDRYQTCEEMGSDIEDFLFELKYRPNAKKLSEYIRSLFGGQYETEKKIMSKTMKYQIPEGLDMDSGSRAKPSFQPTQAFEINSETEEDDKDRSATGLKPKPIHQKTEVMQSLDQADASSFKNKIKILCKIPINFLKEKKARHIRTKKQAAIFATIGSLFLIVLCFSILYLSKTYDEDTIKINHLLEAAERSMDENRLLLPENNCSLFYCREILKSYPENKHAQSGLKDIVSKCVSQAQSAIEKSNPESARPYVKVGLTIEPENESLLAMKKKIPGENDLIKQATDGIDSIVNGISDIFK